MSGLALRSFLSRGGSLSSSGFSASDRVPQAMIASRVRRNREGTEVPKAALKCRNRHFSAAFFARSSFKAEFGRQERCGFCESREAIDGDRQIADLPAASIG